MSSLQLALALLKRSARLDELAGMARFGINPEKRLTVRFWSGDDVKSVPKADTRIVKSEVSDAVFSVIRDALPICLAA